MSYPDYQLDQPESEPAFYCDECGDDIFEGEDYYQIMGYSFCENCVSSFSETAEKSDCPRAKAQTPHQMALTIMRLQEELQKERLSKNAKVIKSKIRV